uniref:Uncharacterized protein n=1 Tax=Angiostrongylus cantonensis TaxID=6313 RepID=A0A0K0CX71_ANGCA
MCTGYSLRPPPPPPPPPLPPPLPSSDMAISPLFITIDDSLDTMPNGRTQASILGLFSIEHFSKCPIAILAMEFVIEFL